MEDFMDLFGVVLPTLLGVLMVVATILIVFWMGSAKQRSYEEAKAQATLKAEEAIREKEKASPKVKKPRKVFRKKKVEEPLGEAESAPPRKGILKTSPPAAPRAETPTNYKVEFKLDTPLKEEGSATRSADPPTPYPSKDASLTGRKGAAAVGKTPQPVFDEEEEEEFEAVKPQEPKKSEVAAKKKQVPVEKPSQTTQKASQKSPQPHAGQSEPAERVVVPKEAEIKRKPVPSAQKRPKGGKSKLVVGSGEESQDGLPASKLTELVRASSLTDEEIEPIIGLLLEKSNANSEWEAPNLKSESNKSLKKLNQELQAKLEEAQQTAVSHGNKIKELRKEVQTEKSKYQSIETAYQSKFNRQAKDLAIYTARSSGLEEELKRMKDIADPQDLQKLREENSHLSSQVAQLQQQQAAMTTQQNSRTVQSSGAVGEKVAELEKLLEQSQEEVEQLKASCQRFQSSLAATCQEKDMLKQKVEQLESSHAQMAAEAQKVSADRKDSLSHIGTLQDDLQKVRTAAAQEKADLQTQHKEEVQELRKELAEAESLQERYTQLEQHNKELIAQVEKGSKIEEQVKMLYEQLEAEKSSKEDLKKELECQAKALPNGPTEGFSNGPEQESEADNRMVKEITELEKKLDELKAKNDDLNECLWQAKQEAGITEKTWDVKLRELQEKLEQDVSSAKSKALQEAFSEQCSLLQQLFPDVSVEECSEGKQEQWLEEFESKAQEIMASRKVENASLKQRIQVLEKQNEESTGETLQFRQTLEKTMNILAELQTKVEKSDNDHKEELREAETALQAERASSKHLQTELGDKKALLDEVRGELGEEKALVGKVKEELVQAKEQLDQEKALVEQVKEELRQEKEVASRVAKEGLGVKGQEEEVARLEERLKQLEQSRTDMEKEVTELKGELKGKEEAREALEQRVAAESKLKENALKQCDELEVAKKDLAERLETMKNSNRELNARLSTFVTQSPTDSEV